jgi:glycosyltransferase involved in cell wall biosynthesis
VGTFNKKVTIVLPVYNGEKFISKAINSIINQTYSNWELIIVNDCSTDNSLEICKKYAQKDNRIRIYSNKVNLKLPKSLNVGFSHAEGDYFTWTSDDNKFKKNALETMIKALENSNGVDMVYSDYWNIDANGNKTNVCRLQQPDKIVESNVCGPCFLYKASIAKIIGEYDENLFLAEDYDYWMRIYIYGKMLHIDDVLYYYRRHDMSLSVLKKDVINYQTYKALEKNFMQLYYKAKINKLEFAFFDQIMNRGNNHVDNINDKLIQIDKRYYWHLLKKNIKNRLYSTSFFELIRQIKNKHF